jgi:hypothetical protein
MLPGHVSHSAFSGFISIYRYEQRSKKSLKGGGMRKKLLFLFTIVLIITMGFISGCGGCSCTSEEEEARHQEFMEDFESLQEDSSILPTEAELGVPVYGENVDPSSVESSMSETDGEVTDVGVDYSTSDDFETVVSWYKGELGPPGFSAVTGRTNPSLVGPGAEWHEHLPDSDRYRRGYGHQYIVEEDLGRVEVELTCAERCFFYSP